MSHSGRTTDQQCSCGRYLVEDQENDGPWSAPYCPDHPEEYEWGTRTDVQFVKNAEQDDL